MYTLTSQPIAMNNRPSISNKRTGKEESPLSNTRPRGRFESRPFVMHIKGDNSKQSNLNTSLMRAEKYGHNLSKMSVEGISGEKEQTGGLQVPVQLAKKRNFSDDDAKLAERRKQEVARQQDLTPENFKQDFMKESTDLADDTIAGRRHGRGRQTLGFHVTREENLPSILSTGLDPDRGGKGGSSELRPGTDFVEQSKGHMHYSDNTYLSGYYADHISSQNRQPNLLGIRRPEHIERDPDEPRGAYRTEDKIPPTDITNLGGKVTSKAMENYKDAEERFGDKLRANTGAKREAGKIPNNRKQEKKEALKKANEEGRKLHFNGRKLTAPFPESDESIPLGEKK